MINKKISLVLASTLVLTGCFGAGEIWEPKTCGVRNSEWYAMSESERYYARRTFEDHERIAQQEKIDRKNQAANEKLQKLKMKNARLENEKLKNQAERERLELEKINKEN